MNWSGYAERDGVTSLPGYLDAHGTTLRSRYAAAIQSIAEARIAGRTVREHLDVGDGTSMWWMGLLAEKSPFKSPRIFDALRLLALEELLREKAASSLVLVTTDDALAHAIQRLCASLGVRFARRTPSVGKPTRRLTERLFRRLPASAQGVIALGRHLLTRISLRRTEAPAWHGGNAVLIVSYFMNFNREACGRGEFQSAYWDGLPELLRDSGKRINWLQFYIPSAAAPRARHARACLAKLNDHQAAILGASWHASLDAFLSPAATVGAVRRWSRLRRSGTRVGDPTAAMSADSRARWMWPLLEGDWRRSICGSVAMMNALLFELLERALASLPRQPLGLYLCEHQGWESALCFLWRKHGHGTLIGVQHSTVRFWDLRYVLAGAPDAADAAPPAPTYVAMNGPAAESAYRAAGYADAALVQVEALRYLADDAPMDAEPSRGDGRQRMLVLGDISPRATRAMIDLVASGAALLESPLEVTVKAHPANPVRASDHPHLTFASTAAPVFQLAASFDVAIAGNSTSSALDAYLHGLSVVIHRDDDDFIFSPLHGMAGIRFVSTAAEFADAVRNVSATSPTVRRDHFFWSDPGLTRWRRLLSELAAKLGPLTTH